MRKFSYKVIRNFHCLGSFFKHEIILIKIILIFFKHEIILIKIILILRILIFLRVPHTSFTWQVL